MKRMVFATAVFLAVVLPASARAADCNARLQLAGIENPAQLVIDKTYAIEGVSITIRTGDTSQKVCSEVDAAHASLGQRLAEFDKQKIELAAVTAERDRLKADERNVFAIHWRALLAAVLAEGALMLILIGYLGGLFTNNKRGGWRK